MRRVLVRACINLKTNVFKTKKYGFHRLRHKYINTEWCRHCVIMKIKIYHLSVQYFTFAINKCAHKAIFWVLSVANRSCRRMSRNSNSCSVEYDSRNPLKIEWSSEARLERWIKLHVKKKPSVSGKKDRITTNKRFLTVAMTVKLGRVLIRKQWNWN